MWIRRVKVKEIKKEIEKEINLNKNTPI